MSLTLFALYFKKLAFSLRSNYALVRKHVQFLLCKNNSSAEELALCIKLLTYNSRFIPLMNATARNYVKGNKFQHTI